MHVLRVSFGNASACNNKRVQARSRRGTEGCRLQESLNIYLSTVLLSPMLSLFSSNMVEGLILEHDFMLRAPQLQGGPGEVTKGGLSLLLLLNGVLPLLGSLL